MEKEEDGIVMQIKQLRIKGITALTWPEAHLSSQVKQQKEEEAAAEGEEWESCGSSSDISGVSDESDFSWYDEEDTNNYFVVSTLKP